MLIRPVTLADLSALYAIALESGPGFTSLMPDREALAHKIVRSIKSFDRQVITPANEHYLFVLEDKATGDIMGTTGIQAAVGLDRPLRQFRRSGMIGSFNRKQPTHHQETLTRCEHYRGCTEICSLYLRPQYRQANAGKLLSRVRFLFMALHPERFSDTVIAEMRGVSDQHGHSPFWHWLRHQVADLDFAAVTQLTASPQASFLEQRIPTGPLPTSAMDDAARAVIGQVHHDTRPALRMLEQEGFRHCGMVDLVDAGPTLECPRLAIASVRNSYRCGVTLGQSGSATGPGNTMILANTLAAGFRATLIDVAHVGRVPGQVIVPQRIGQQLGLDETRLACALPLWRQPARHHHTAATGKEVYHAL